jgi:voltage-gated potassium channel
MKMRSQFDEFLVRRGSMLLMGLLIVVTLASPLADTQPHIGAALALLLLIGVILGARLSANKRIITRVVLPLSGVWIIVRILEGFSDQPRFYNLQAHIVGLALSCAVLWAVFDHLDTTEVTSSVIAEAFISYLIIAIAFSQLFWILNELVTDAFNQKLLPVHSSEFLYFSMITLTSVGYGGIAPVDPFVRLVAAFESMAGIFYVAIVVARLVSSYRPLREQVNSAKGK